MAAGHESWASSPAVRATMQGNRRRDTLPEMAVRRLIHARGMRYRVDARPLASLNRRADLVFVGPKVALFIDGCFWHGCPEHSSIPKTNSDYWAPKIARNVERDKDTTEKLEAAGWRVLRAWEHEEARSVADRVEAAVGTYVD